MIFWFFGLFLMWYGVKRKLMPGFERADAEFFIFTDYIER